MIVSDNIHGDLREAVDSRAWPLTRGLASISSEFDMYWAVS